MGPRPRRICAAIQSVHGLKRVKPFVSRNGLTRDARFELRDDRVLAYAGEFLWSWTANPFLGSHELKGLKILIMLASNLIGTPRMPGMARGAIRRCS